MSKSKKSTKMRNVPHPIKVKKEKLEEDRVLHSMAHFVDDRVELIKQIFGSLKTKTITNLAPEYLKVKNMEEIQELCLNELLCLSSKRLSAIINGTKCPTDTESSEDSDVEAKEAHISLEEISSGSELDNDKISRRTTSQSRPKKDPKKPNQDSTKNGNDGQMSVLELLELQARARAIRSQLALEPVTKIELDVDDQTNPSEKVSSTTKEPKSSRKQEKKANGKETVQKSTPTSTSGSVSATPSVLVSASASKTQESRNKSPTIAGASKKNSEVCPPAKTGRKIKLKRNFRKKTEESEETPSSEKDNQKMALKVKREKKSRSPSPDIIPIEPVPETLCISDSGSDSEAKVKSKQETRAKQTNVEKDEEAEDGEIVESEEPNIKDSTTIPADSTKETAFPKENGSTKSINSATILRNEVLVKPVEAKSMEDKTKNNDSTEPRKKNDQTENKSKQDAEKSDGIVNSVNANEDTGANSDFDADQNDDVISIEGGDLENEMSEHLDFTTNKSDVVRNYDDNDVISLESSDNDDVCARKDIGQSWHARYLESPKVNKVLAVSRLGKRMRDKLKTSKHSKREPRKDTSKTKEDETDKFKSMHEEGSVEQYKEILEISHRKS